MGQPGGIPPNVTLLAEAGWDGWEIVGILPRTTGLALSNNVGQQTIYGGGVGGLTDGAYLLMRLPVTITLLEDRPEYVEAILSSMHDLVGSTARTPATPRIQAGDMGRSAAGSGVPAAAAAGAGGVFIAYGVTRTDYEGEGSEVGETDGGDFDFDF